MKHALTSLRILALALISAVVLPTNAQTTIPLYPTGPTADSSFLRFIDGTGSGLTVESAAGTTTLTPEQSSTSFASVQSKWPVKGQVLKGEQKAPVELQVQPGEFVSVVALAGADGLRLQVLREDPDDFNALKASIGFANTAEQACAPAGLQVAGHDMFLFEQAPTTSLQRRLINPLKLSVQLTCGGKPTGEALALGQLEAGERYSVLVVPDAAKGARLVFAHDKLGS